MEIYWQNTEDQEKSRQLIEQGLIQEDDLKALIFARQERIQSAHASLKGQLYQMDETHAICAMKDSISLSTLRKIELVSEYELLPCSQNLGTDIILLDAQHPEILATEPFSIPQTLLNTKDAHYIYPPDFTQQDYLIESNVFYCPYLPELNQTHGPFDMTFSSNGEHLCIADRKDGSVFFLRTLDYELVETYQLRAEGQSYPLFMALDDKDKHVYYIDGQTPHLYVLELSSGALEQYLLEDEIPAYILLSEKRHLYLLIKSPVPKIKLLNLDTLETVAEYYLPSTFNLDDENHLHQLILSPNGDYLTLLTLQNQAPVLLHLTPKELAPIKLQPLSKLSRPFLVTHGHLNPLKNSMALRDILLSAGKMTAEEWDAFFEKTRETIQASDSPEVVSDPLAPQMKTPLQSVPSASKTFLSHLAKPHSWTQPHPDDTIFLPSESIDDILQILTGTFFQQSGVSLDEHPDDLARFWNLAKEARIQLQDFDSFQAHLPEVLGQHDFKAMVYRQSVQTMAQLRDNTQKVYETPPTHCPSCHYSLLGSWDCSSCGLEIENSIRQRKRKIASWDAHHWLPPDYFALPDMAGGRLLLLNSRSFQYVAWELNLRSLPWCLEPSHVLWLDHLHMLVTDSRTHEVFETSSSGELRYRYQARTEHAQLLHPVKATLRINDDGDKRYLIVDKGNHRVLEVDEQHGVQWEFGHKSEPGTRPGYLNEPSDIQFTHEGSYLIADTGNNRVLEVVDGKVHRQFGEGDLDFPIYAQRLFNGDTVVADHSGKIYTYDIEGKLQGKIPYNHPKLESSLKMPHPIQVLRRPQSTFVLLDQNKMIEVDPRSQRIKWSREFEQMKLKVGQQDLGENEDLKRPLAVAFDDFGPPEPAHIVTLRQMLKDVSIFSEAPESFFLKIEAGFRSKTFKAGEIVIHKGKLSKSMYFIQSGQLEILGDDQEGAVLLLNAGDSFGYMSLVFNEPRKSTIRCSENCNLVVLDKKHFDKVIENFQGVAKKARTLAAERLVISKLKKSPKHMKPSERLQALIDKNKAKLTRYSSKVEPKVSLNVQYTPSEQEQIDTSFLKVYEIELWFHQNYRMRSARLYLVNQVLGHLGVILKTTPHYLDIPEEEELGHQFIFTLATSADQAQIIEDLMAIAEVEKVTRRKIHDPRA